MIPLRDENPTRTVPVVTRTIIALNVAVFLYEVSLGPARNALLLEWGFRPVALTLAARFHEFPLGEALLPLFTSMFLHGGWAHLVGNMWYLWLFGDNVEDVLGHLRFLAFYVMAGAAAALMHYATNPYTELPMIGASGAIAGVLGGYLVAFPRARVHTLLPFFPFIQVVPLPAFLVLGLWLIFQFVLGFGSLGQAGGGIAFWAHVGGFGFGWLAMRLLAGTRRPPLEAR